jgi:hypothetical protein
MVFITLRVVTPLAFSQRRVRVNGRTRVGPSPQPSPRSTEERE